MKAFLKNYTSNVPVSQTIHRIEQVLLKCGVTGIAKEYALNTKIKAVTFKIETPAGSQAIRLPADEKKAHDALWLDYVGDDLLPNGNLKWSSRKRKPKADFEAQAERTAWKIVQDWVEVQMSMIHMQQADILEVFMPYIWNGRQTYYQALKESNYAGLLAEKTMNHE